MSQTTTFQDLAPLMKEVMEKQAQLNEALRNLPDEPVSDYTFSGAGGQDVRLSDLFGPHDDLIVIHNMGKGCVYCTLWLDGFIGLHDHFLSRTGFVVVSPDAPDVQAEFAASRGWPFRMVSNGDSGFTKAMGYEGEHEGKPAYHPGYSVFSRSGGELRRVSRSYFGPGDPYCGIWHMLDTLDGGRGDWAPKYTYGA